jgi:hypothetical protein
VQEVEDDSDKQEEEEDSDKLEEDSDDSAIRLTKKRARVVQEPSDSETEELPDDDIRKNIGEYVINVYEEQWFLAEIAKDQSGVGQC